MRKLQIVLWIIGVVQLVLGFLYLFMPIQLMVMMGHPTPGADVAYPLGMLAARFLAYGVGMFFVARDPAKHVFWINNMILIQAVDLAAGIFYTATGVIDLSHSAFPMFNATMFIILLSLWRPKSLIAATKSSGLGAGA